MEVLNGRVTTLLLIRLTRIQVGGGQKVGCILGRSSVHRRQNTHLRVHVRLISKPAKHVFGLRKETPAATRRTCKLYTERPHPTGRFTRGQTR